MDAEASWRSESPSWPEAFKDEVSCTGLSGVCAGAGVWSTINKTAGMRMKRMWISRMI